MELFAKQIELSALILYGCDASTADALDGLLRALLAARGGVAFGVCRTCRFHEARAGGRHCGLLDVPLGEAQADRVCVEHAAQ